ncbi:MAG: 23S rRNA (guanosine(2251)-2'-O)-methyltransferase RlmB [Desulforhopalus sp.]
MKKKSSVRREAGEKRLRVSEDMLWGVHPVIEALHKEPGRFSEIYLQKDRRGAKINEIIEMARQAGVKLSFTESLRLTGAGSAQVRHQGIVARMNEVPLLPFEDLLAKMASSIKRGECPRLIICDSLQDPHNLGAIIRSALASGAAGVVVTRERSAPIGGTAAKSSAGAISHIDICQVTNLATALQDLKKTGFWVFGAVKDDDAQSLYETDLTVSACLIVGGEGKGIRPLIKKQCDALLSIPMAGDLDSLNSSVAAAIILFEAMRQSLASQRSSR